MWARPPARTQRPLRQRFEERIDRSGGPDACHQLSGTQPDEYGRIGEGGRRGRDLYAHRVAWEMAHGPIPDGMEVMHTCDNPPCCNVRHLKLGTHAQNMADMAAKGRVRQRGTGPRGERHWAAKLSADDVATIRREYTPGRKRGPGTRKALAARFGIDRSTVARIATGRSWT